ncbi:MAG TPA: DUF1700 domain-containing protein [Halanaerobiales bacterium]|nr:DUF1700 domain-containing protein [Halanaerobiales bacterium]
MNKDVFLSRLESFLGDEITSEEKKDILNDYKNHFSMNLDNGKSEKEISRSLGDPKSIAKRVKASVIINRAEDNTSSGKIFRAILAIFRLSFSNLVFILGPYLGVVVGFFALFVTGISLSFAGIVLFLSGAFLELLYPWFIDIPVQPFVSISLSLGITTMGLFWTMAITKLITLTYKKTVKYLKIHIRTVKFQTK